MIELEKRHMKNSQFCLMDGASMFVQWMGPRVVTDRISVASLGNESATTVSNLILIFN